MPLRDRGGVLPAAFCLLLAGFGCAGGAEPYQGTGAGTGGATAAGGGNGSGSGGNSTGTGGSATGTGGGVVGTGGKAGTGGVTGTGGRPAAPPRFTLPWMDDFEANAVNGDASGWIKDPGETIPKWAVVMDGTTKVLQEQAAVSAASFIVGGDVGWTDQKVEAKVKFPAITSSSLALVAVRFVDFDNYYFLHLKGDGSMKIRKRIGGSTTDLVAYKSGTALVAGTWYTIGFGFSGTTVTAYLNGMVVGTMTDSPPSLPAGGIALGFQDAAGGSFDDVKVTAP
jgi:Concanavalin A-like lectin/glucanases superfamily